VLGSGKFRFGLVRHGEGVIVMKNLYDLFRFGSVNGVRYGPVRHGLAR
jgi:hypothetical protein